MTRFKDIKEAKQLLAEKIGGKVTDAFLRSVIHVGEDAHVSLTISGDYSKCSLRATVESADMEFRTGSRAPWCGIKAVEGERVRPSGAGAFSNTRPLYYDADIDALAVKVQALIEPLRGSHAKALAMRAQKAETSTSQFTIRCKYAPRLVELGLMTWAQGDDSEERPYIVERRQNYMMPVKVMDSPLHLDSNADHIKVSFRIPWDKAEAVLTFLRDQLNTKGEQ